LQSLVGANGALSGRRRTRATGRSLRRAPWRARHRRWCRRSPSRRRRRPG
jgi:hypothetical protein